MFANKITLTHDTHLGLGGDGQGNKMQQDFVDSYCHDTNTNLQIFVLCDGMSGYPGGEVASKVVVQQVIDTFNTETSEATEDSCTLCINTAQQKLLEQQQELDFPNMRTTVVVAIVDTNNAVCIVGSIGDSRFYLIESDENTVTCDAYIRTKDHTAAQSEVNNNSISDRELISIENRSGLYKSLGKSLDSDFQSVVSQKDILKLSLNSGDAFLLCSDGLWEYVFGEEILIDRYKSNTVSEWLSNLVLRRWKSVYKQKKMDSDNYSLVGVFVN